MTNAGIELSPVYESPIVLKPDGFLPSLATDWSFVNSGSTFRLKLRKGVTFQDGTPFNAQAVKANLDRVLTFPGSTLTALLSAVKQVDVVDDSTVDLQLHSGGATLPALLADSPGRMVSPATFGNPQYLSYL